MALLFQNFDFEFDDPNYRLQHKQTLTIKPKDFYVRATLRKGITSTSLCRHLQGNKEDLAEADSIIRKNREKGAVLRDTSGLAPITILYGSNSGTCESMAQRLAADAPIHGYSVTQLESLNSGTGKLPRDQPVIIFTASYEGQPPDNAGQFVRWLESGRSKDALEGVRYAVFGCGNSEWPQTFHRIPKLVDETMSACGAERLVEMGLTNAASDDVFIEFENWEDKVSHRQVDITQACGIYYSAAFMLRCRLKICSDTDTGAMACFGGLERWFRALSSASHDIRVADTRCHDRPSFYPQA